MRRGEIVTVLFSIGDHVVRLRRTIDDLAEHLRDDERTRLLAALAHIEQRNAQLFCRVQKRHRDSQH